MQSSNIAYSEKLDHLRFLAAFTVLMFHAEITMPPVEVWFPLFHQGHAGVQLFMVISGLILSMIAYGRKLDIPRFYANRVLRIYPLFIVIVSLGYFTNPDRPTSQGLDYLLALLPVSNLYRGAYGPFGGQLWSVAVELQFYLLFPFLLIAIEKYGERFAWFLLGFLILMRILVLKATGTVHMMAYLTIFGALDAFVIGMLAGRFHMRRGREVSAWWAVAAFVLVNAVLYVLFRKNFFHWDYDSGRSVSPSRSWVLWPTFEAFLFAFLVLAYMNGRFTLPFSAAAAALGRWSYSIYVWHSMLLVMIVRAVEPLGLHSYVVGFGIALPLTVAVAYASYHVIERPFLEMRMRYVT